MEWSTRVTMEILLAITLAFSLMESSLISEKKQSFLCIQCKGNDVDGLLSYEVMLNNRKPLRLDLCLSDFRECFQSIRNSHELERPEVRHDQHQFNRE